MQTNVSLEDFEDEEPDMLSCGECGGIDFHLFSNGYCYCSDCGCQVVEEGYEISIH
jgi:hypothetical protein